MHITHVCVVYVVIAPIYHVICRFMLIVFTFNICNFRVLLNCGRDHFMISNVMGSIIDCFGGLKDF